MTAQIYHCKNLCMTAMLEKIEKANKKVCNSVRSSKQYVNKTRRMNRERRRRGKG
jgi:hypothetical protein